MLTVPSGPHPPTDRTDDPPTEPPQQRPHRPAPWLDGDVAGMVAYLQRSAGDDYRTGYFAALRMIRDVQEDAALSSGAKNRLTLAVLEAAKQYGGHS